MHLRRYWFLLLGLNGRPATVDGRSPTYRGRAAGRAAERVDPASIGQEQRRHAFAPFAGAYSSPHRRYRRRCGTRLGSSEGRATLGLGLRAWARQAEFDRQVVVRFCRGHLVVWAVSRWNRTALRYDVVCVMTRGGSLGQRGQTRIGHGSLRHALRDYGAAGDARQGTVAVTGFMLRWQCQHALGHTISGGERLRGAGIESFKSRLGAGARRAQYQLGCSL